MEGKMKMFYHKLWQHRETSSSSEDNMTLPQFTNTHKEKTAKCIKCTHVSELSDTCLQTAFSYLSGYDLKNCRFVCRQWKANVDEVIGDKSTIIFEGKGKSIIGLRFHTMYFSKKCKRYLKESLVGFELWTSIRMRNIWTGQIASLIGSPIFSVAVGHITYLELKYCKLTWQNLVDILKCLESLETLKLIKNWYYYYSLGMEDYFLSAGSHDLVVQRYGKYWPRFSKGEKLYCKKLTSVYIEERRNLLAGREGILPRRGTIEVMCILRKLRVKIKKLEFKLELQSELTTEDDQNVLWLKMTKLITTCEIRVLRIELTDSSDLFAFERFLQLTAGLFSLFPVISIEELYLHFPILIIEDMFSSHIEFAGFLESIKNLKILEIGTFLFYAQSARLFKMLKPKQKECQVNVGIIFTDKHGWETVKDSIEMLTSLPFFKNILHQFEIYIFDKDKLVDLKPILPVTYNSNGNYENFPQMKEFRVSFTNEEVRRNFLSFNITIIVELFPNLTVLTLTCGPSSEIGYFNFLMDHGIQNAAIDDYDLRLILLHLINLKTLSLWANLEEVTDFGVTGRIFEFSQDCVVGHSFSRLKDLEKVSLRGVGHKVSDHSAFHGFNDLPKLSYLEIIGKHKISKGGEEFLRNKSKSGFYRFKLSLIDGCMALLV